jgi:CRP-like cAMP-binding protein
MAELNIVEKVIALEAVELLSGLTPEQLSRIAAVAREVRVGLGKPIFDSRQPLDALYVVIDGAVVLSRGGTPLVEAGPNQVLGAWSLFDDDPLPVTATTREPTRLLRVGREEFYDVLSDNAEITAALFSTLVRRFRKLVENQ